MRTSFICSSKGVGALEGAREEKAVEEFSFAALRKAWSESSVEMKLSSMLLIDWVSLEMMMLRPKFSLPLGGQVSSEFWTGETIVYGAGV